MATTTVALGKLEIAERLGLPIPLGWAVDETGTPTDDPGRSIARFRARAGGGLLPLGGAGEALSGYKGYGLALWMDIMAGVLSGAAYASRTYHRMPDGKVLPANVGHFFGAWRIDAFRPAAEFRASMDDLLRLVKDAPKAEGQERIYIAGEKEFECAERNLAAGVPLDAKLVQDLLALAGELGEPLVLPEPA
jgi:LDH2 family malate/lactate/ureidoglycolate dehydrogenase